MNSTAVDSPPQRSSDTDSDGDPARLSKDLLISVHLFTGDQSRIDFVFCF